MPDVDNIALAQAVDRLEAEVWKQREGIKALRVTVEKLRRDLELHVARR